MEPFFFGEALQFHLDLCEALSSEVVDSCEQALAHARLGYAIEETIEALAHPALSLERRGDRGRERYRLSFLGRRILEWRLGPYEVELRSWGPRDRVKEEQEEKCDAIVRSYGGTPVREPAYDRLALLYIPHAREWCLSEVESKATLSTFTDEREHVLAVTATAVEAYFPWSEPGGIVWAPGFENRIRVSPPSPR
ncbi:MAG: hypothetical protein WBQ14_02170 [Gaiellaceae bacterium]